MAIETTTHPIKTNITGSITLERLLIDICNSESYMVKILSKVFERLAVSSQTLIIIATSAGISSNSNLR